MPKLVFSDGSKREVTKTQAVEIMMIKEDLHDPYTTSPAQLAYAKKVVDVVLDPPKRPEGDPQKVVCRCTHCAARREKGNCPCKVCKQRDTL